jgi:acyl transferase domain-containing protein/NADPH:quinone reductase-like Zn-dependent oxidoreductase/NAD(P)-dependent dehydrogenase (short-subunit alcohol dehydrogenase family)/SAM-dependent methyltransferase/acyl carrier protein
MVTGSASQSAPAEQLTAMQKERIAIIGVGCRFPGGVSSKDSLWKLLVEGREGIIEVPPDRWNVERYYDAEPGVAGKSIALRGGFIDAIDQFDPQFFGISPREAPYVDPQHRLLLETAWEAIEDAGLVLDFERGADLGVFVGISHNDYQGIQSTSFDHFSIGPHTPTGSAHSIAANRISYCLNLRGPSVAMDTACSSALTAVHAACEHIWAGRGDVALAGGVTVMISPGGFIGFSQAAMLSPEGRCAAFDASASGFVRGEGAGMVLLKRLSRALEDGDPIHSVILGTSINQDGHTNGIWLPSPEAQTRLVQDACRDAGIAPEKIGFVEAHGTGTAVGDPIEAHALAEALCRNRSVDAPLPIGSIKTNLGHLETAAGIAGLIKAMLVLKHAQIPPSLHFSKPNPHIDFEKLKLRVPTQVEPFPNGTVERIAGVNSFGFGGANAHVILAEPPPHQSQKSSAIPGYRPWPVMLSARSEASLRISAANLSAWVREHANANGNSPVLPDLSYTLGVRRNHHPHRLTLVASDWAGLTEELDAFAKKEDSPKIRAAFAPRREHAPRIGFIMSGQGPQWWGMGRDLMRHEPVFRETIERCDAALRPWASFSLLEELGRSEETSQLHRTEVGQPSIFAMQVALATLWKSWGVEPSAIVGHSVGEIAAAGVAGIFSFEEAARIVALRARLMESCGRGEGTMLAIGLPEEEALALIARHDRTVTISAVNGPRSITLSGPRISLEAMAAELEAQGAFARPVKVDHPFHHPLMRPASEALEAELAELEPQPGNIPFFSTVTGERCAGESCDAAYWARGIREQVRFASAVGALADFGVDVWLELNAHPALAHSTQECLTARGTKVPVISSVRRDREFESMLESAMDLHRAGVPLDFSAMTPSRHLLSLPAYAWEKTRWWNEASDAREGRLGPGGRGLFDVRLPRAMPTWVVRLDSRHMAFLKDHKVENHVIFPAAAFVEMALEAGVQLFEGRPFVVEDFEIRKPLILPDPASSVQLELSYSPNERTFTIESRFEQGVAWSQHVVGSLRGERTESAFASSKWEQPPDAQPIVVEDFYRHMSDLGLRYGEEFRPIRDLVAGAGRSAGRVALSDVIARRAGEYALHPVLFDGALQVFSAGAATVEDRQARMKLPVRFARILFLGSPGASSRVCARVQEFSDDFLEGDIALYDEAEKPCVLVDGFRAISIAGAGRSAPRSTRDLTYHVAWERTPSDVVRPAFAPLPLEQLHAATQHALDRAIALRGRSELEAAIRDVDELAAAQLARGLREMGVTQGISFNADTLRVAAPMRRAFERLAAGLVNHGVLAKKEGRWEPAPGFVEAADSAGHVLRSYIEKHPGHLPEALLCEANCAELGVILRGEKDAVQVLFSGIGTDLLEQFYGDGLFTSQWLGAIAAALDATARRLPEGRGLRILEIGAGTGGLASQALPLLERGLHSYIFSDVSAAFFSAAQQKLAAFPEVEFKIFDLEKPGVAQELEAASFDVIVGTNVVHAVSDVRTALRNLHDLLAPGGSLIFMDTATPQLWTETVFGLTSGWWRFTDRDLRPEQPLLERAQWEMVLRETGFSETMSLPGLIGPTGGEGQIGLLARKAGQEIAAPVKTAVEAPEEKSWLVFADESELSDRLISRLRETGVRCRVARPGDNFEFDGTDAFTLRREALEDWKKVFEEYGEKTPERIVYLCNLDARIDDGTMSSDLDALLYLAQALETDRPGSKLRFDLVTRGAQPVGRDLQPNAVGQAPAIGLMRVISNEHSKLFCRGIDLHFEPSPSDVALLWSELILKAPEREIAFRGEARYAQRLDRGRPSREQWLDPALPLRLDSRERGHLDTLRFTPFELPQCGPGQALIDVKAAGMNFRDVLKALALYPGDAPDARIFGDEVAGVVRQVGSGVTHVAPGDRVFGLAVFGIATQTLARGSDVRCIPAGLSFEEAATLPVVFMTSWHALRNVARLRKGERILVHAGAGGVGMAAIQIAHHLGAEVIATAGSPSKRALLKTLGVKHVIDSRRGDFAEAVMEMTNRKGVDVVLNALAGEAIPMGLSCLAEFGRFIEIGKRDIYHNARIPLRPLRANASFHVVAMDAVFHGDEALTRQMLEEICDLVERGALRPLPYRAFPACRIDAAFRLMASGKHIGKVVVAFATPFVPRRGEPPAPGFNVKPDGSYLITGAFGGYGKVLARWLVDCGARHLVLTSRSGASNPEAAEFVADMQERGVEVRVVSADIGAPDDVRRLFEEIKSSAQPLRGVFHLAMVIDDAPFTALTSERMQAVIAPKAHGAWLLHEATRKMDLDCFVMFSSVSSIFGNPAQGNYSAANAFIDALAHHRQALGLPALTVNWGVLGGEGYVARNERVADFLARQGTNAISAGEAMALLESFLCAGSAQAISIRVDWKKWRQFFRGMQENPLLERIFAALENEETVGATSSWRSRIDAASPAEKQAVICQAVREAVGSVLRVKPDSLREDQPLTDLGLDSLMGVEIETSLEAAVGVALPPTSLMRARTIGQIASLIAGHLGGAASVAESTPVSAQTEATSAVDLDAISHEEIERLLGREAESEETKAIEEAKR